MAVNIITVLLVSLVSVAAHEHRDVVLQQCSALWVKTVDHLDRFLSGTGKVLSTQLMQFVS